MANDLTFDSKVTHVISRIAFGFAFICVALRFYTRLRIRVRLGWDDWWILIGFLMTSLTYALLQWGANVDRHVGEVIDEAFENHTIDTFDTKPHETFLKLYFVCSILYFFLVMAIKISILLMYRRIFSVDPLFRLQSFLIGVFVVALWLAATITRIFFCRPIGYIWMGLNLERHCLPYDRFWIAVGVIDITVDIVILALPVRMVLKIQLSPKQKASITCLFLLGGFVVITGLLRAIYIYLLNRTGPSYSQGEFWSTIHITTAIVCACLPTLRPLFTRRPLVTSTPTSTPTSACASPFRWRYYHLRGWHSCGNSPNHDKSIEPKFVNAMEIPSSSGSRFDRYPRVTNPHEEKVWFRDNRLV